MDESVEDQATLAEIADLRRKGARVLLRRNASGKGHVKVVFGPLGLMKRRYCVNEATFSALKQLCGV
jgi:peptide methionine sulfoxide reductase MsrB